MTRDATFVTHQQVCFGHVTTAQRRVISVHTFPKSIGWHKKQMEAKETPRRRYQDCTGEPLVRCTTVARDRKSCKELVSRSMVAVSRRWRWENDDGNDDAPECFVV